MWARNPDYKKFPAVACYNKGYRLANPANVDAVASVKFELGLLNTEYVASLHYRHDTFPKTLLTLKSYDCMYIQGPNQFFTDSEGGFINVSLHSSFFT
jgi:hypothetical protein